MDILVTGSTGLLGKSLVPRLQQRGHRVLAFTGDIRDAQNVDEQVAQVQAVIHLAGVLDENDALGLYEVNVGGTRHVLEACEKHRVQHLILASTAGVYGKTTGILDEKTPMAPETPYEKSKAQAETAAQAHLETIPLTIVRLALVLGPNEYWKGIVTMVKRNFPVIGNGSNAFMTVSGDDAASAIAFLVGHPDAIGEIFIVAQEQAPSLNEVVGELRKQLGMNSEIRHMPYWQAMLGAYVSLVMTKITGKKTVFLPHHVERLVRERRYSIDKIRALGWKPGDSTASAVQKMLAGLK
jgi:nucleoside-diphosphate-sugar epimerase